MPNQTTELTPISDINSKLYNISIEYQNLMPPELGIQSYCFGRIGHNTIIVCGKTNGLHSFDNININAIFNTNVYVINNGSVRTKSILNTPLCPLLCMSNAQFYQHGTYLYICGGFYKDINGVYETRDALIVIDLVALVKWIIHDSYNPKHLYKCIRDPIFKITGGAMYKWGRLTLLILGQQFSGSSILNPSNFTQVYNNTIIKFDIILKPKNNKSVSKELSQMTLKIVKHKPYIGDDSFHRTNFNVVRGRIQCNGKQKQVLIVYSGSFTPSDGIWTIPICLDKRGNQISQDFTLMQGMNNFQCPAISFYSRRHKTQYVTLLGGITYQTSPTASDPELPFTNLCTTISMRGQTCHQYLMSTQYPSIPNGQNDGVLLFGSGAYFIHNNKYNLDHYMGIKKSKNRIHIGNIVGGIASKVPNTITQSDTFASPYIFKVYINF